MEVKCGIYKITSPTNGIYVGQSLNILKRFSDYRILKCKRQTCLYNSFLKHGVISHSFEIIEECLPEQLNEKERYYIKTLESFNTVNGMNLTDGGGSNGTVSNETRIKIGLGNLGKTVSEKSKVKMSISQLARADEISKLISKRNIGNTYAKGNKLSQERIQKLKESKIGLPAPMQGKKHTKEAIEKMRNAKTGKIVSAETGAKISLALKGRVMSEEHKEKIRQSRLGRTFKKNPRTKI